MKGKLLIWAPLFFCISSLAQGKTALTKEETVDYLNKKQEEIIGHYRSVEKTKYYYWEQSVRLSVDNIVLKLTRSTYKEAQEGKSVWLRGTGVIYIYPCDYWINYHESVFNPAHIEKIELADNNIPGEPVGIIKITLKSNTGKHSYITKATTKKVINTESEYYDQCCEVTNSLRETENQTESTNEVYFTFLKADETNFNKIKKALEYLRDLLKAEDDPFGN